MILGFDSGGRTSGQSVPAQGTGRGVAAAAIVLAAAAGLRVFATSRYKGKLKRAVEPGPRAPSRRIHGCRTGSMPSSIPSAPPPVPAHSGRSNRAALW
ncbi:hypothetical protein FHS36_005187 [Streptomyces eurocidicus]|uniref:Uncharacterized protein n=1 Tax=Streptomyces eurocidicus TaxID=66423 RepID=A0A7W8BF73_STREU|nr:hypothetical protein [Streptomyces eurocidicus]